MRIAIRSIKQTLSYRDGITTISAEINTHIENLQFDLESDWITEDSAREKRTKHDLESLKIVLGHLLTLQEL